MRTPIYSAFGALFAPVFVALAGPLPPPPAGFKIAQDALSDALKAGGKGDGLEATKPNDNWPKCPGDADIHLRYNWRTSPTADKYVDFMGKMGKTGKTGRGKRVSLNCAIFPLLRSAPQTAPTGSCW